MSRLPPKAAYVVRQGQTRKHHCHWPGCTKQVPPAMWGCREHWYSLPKNLRDRVWRAYRPGQEKDQRPSRQYLAVARDVQAWIQTQTKGQQQPAQSEAPLLIHCSPKPDACAHDFQGWREFDDGRGGEQVCTKCGMGAMAYSLRVGP